MFDNLEPVTTGAAAVERPDHEVSDWMELLARATARRGQAEVADDLAARAGRVWKRRGPGPGIISAQHPEVFAPKSRTSRVLVVEWRGL